MPTLEWIGKSKVVNHHQEVPFRVLERKYSYDENGQHEADNGSENMIIRGDNLEALKALLPRYEGRVKCIYIDPPYNTGNEGWVYNDNVNDPKIKKWLGEVVGKEGEDLTRHDKWLCMMYPRLKLLHKLLSNDGAIFISIDDNEVYSLKSICDEIFGSNCFVARITWQNNYSLRNDAKGIPYETDNIVVYSKQPNWSPKRLARTDEMNARYVNYDNDVLPYKVTPIHAPGASTHKSMVYAIQHPLTGELMYPPKGRHWKDGQDKLLAALCEWAPYELRVIDDIPTREDICGDAVSEDTPAIMLSCELAQAQKIAKNRYAAMPWPSYFFLSKGYGSIQAKTYLDPEKGKVVSTLWRYEDVGTNVEATNELKVILKDSQLFDTPKPVRLIERIVQIATDPETIILDSFAGSGTTAHAVLSANKADGGNRKFILVEMENYAETITAERVKRVVSGYRADKEEVLYDEEITAKNLAKGAEMLKEAKEIAATAKGKYSSVKAPKVENGRLIVTAVTKAADQVAGTGGNFSFYDLGAQLLIGDNLNEAVDTEKIREYIWFMETKAPYAPVSNSNPYYLGNHNDTGYYFYYKPQMVTVLDYAFLATITEKASGTIIYADRCSIGEDKLAQMGITFKKIPRDISRL